MLRKVRSSDISAIAAVYGRHVAEAGYGPIADIGAVVTASVMRQPLVLPYDALGNAECPQFDIDFCVAESAHGELVGFYICKTWATGSQHPAWPQGVETELWYVAVASHLQGLGIGLRLVREALLINRSRTRGMGGLLARLLGGNPRMRSILQSQGFIEVDEPGGIAQLWLDPGSEDADDFADILAFT
jgi:ribosomal protein S18 acetylase RimI-like enzyme